MTAWHSSTLLLSVIVPAVFLGPVLAQEELESKERQGENRQVAAQLPEGEGKSILLSRCVLCHSLSRVAAGRKSLKSWTNAINVMVANGATIEDSEIRPLAVYLAANFALPVNVNTAPLAELAGVHGLDPKLASAIAGYREKNGPFDKLEDLTKVEGITEDILKTIVNRLTVGVRPANPNKTAEDK